MNNSRFKRLNPVELAVIQPDLLRVPSILRHELFSNDIELVVRKEDATSNRRLGSLNFNLELYFFAPLSQKSRRSLFYNFIAQILPIYDKFLYFNEK